MLATSPSQSPRSYNTSSSNNGSGVVLSQHSYQSSPRFAPSSQSHSPRTSSEKPRARHSTATSPPLRMIAYADASTQYSPMSEVPSNRPRSMPLNENASVDANHGSTLPANEPSTSSQSPKTIPPSSESPSIKRRQSQRAKDEGTSSVAAAVPSLNASKRPKAAKPSPKVLPNKYENCEVEDMVILIADMISELIETNDNLPLQDVVLTRFHSRTPPGISVLDYLQRLAKHATLGPALLLSMVYYIDRLCSLYPAFTITTLTVHRFLITAATVAAKGLSDSFWNNTTYARVGGLKLAELGMLELEFLYRVDWKIVPNPEVLVDYYRGLVARTDWYILETDLPPPETQQVSSRSADIARLAGKTNQSSIKQ